MRPAHQPNRTARGFTLVEVMISLSLAVIVLGCAYACLSAGFAAQKLIEPRADAIQTARVALALMTADLRGACVLPGGTDFLGVQRRLGGVPADNLDFATHNYSPAQPQEGDFCEVSYFLDPNPQTGQLSLWRRRNPIIALDPLDGGKREEIASGIRGLQLEYSDGIEWYDSWGALESTQRKLATSSRYRGNLYGLPETVRITLLLEPEGTRPKGNEEGAKPAPPLVFSTVARVHLASSSQSSSGTTGASEGTAPANPAPATPGPRQ